MFYPRFSMDKWNSDYKRENILLLSGRMLLYPSYTLCTKANNLVCSFVKESKWKRYICKSITTVLVREKHLSKQRSIN